MNLNQILLVVGGIVIYRLLFNHRGKQWVLFIASLIGIFWLQPASLLRNADYWLPFATIFLVLITWIVVTPKKKIFSEENRVPLLFLFIIPILVSGMRFLPLNFFITPTIPPQPYTVLTILAISLSLFSLILIIKNERFSPYLQLIVILGLFVIQKNPTIQDIFISLVGKISGQAINSSSSQNINLSWLGFSYVAFRLIHTIRDFQNKRFQAVDLKTYFNFVIYLPAIAAGPIDRIQNFEKELGKQTEVGEDLIKGGKRMIVGLVKKFVIADFLFIFAINPANISFVKSIGWLWVMLIAYTLMIYLDFSGYTDIALGMSAFLGISLPENFNYPYSSRNLTIFWNRWHMSLTQWIRAYFYFPLTRILRSKFLNKSQIFINSFSQLCTMIMIGLWHGITLNFLIWGLWHGLGLVFHKQWNDWMQKLGFSKFTNGKMEKIFSVLSTTLTFLFVSLGWVWFAMPETHSALLLFGKLLGK